MRVKVVRGDGFYARCCALGAWTPCVGAPRVPRVDVCALDQLARRVLPYLHRRDKTKDEITFLITCLEKGNIKFNMTTYNFPPPHRPVFRKMW